MFASSVIVVYESPQLFKCEELTQNRFTFLLEMRTRCWNVQDLDDFLASLLGKKAGTTITKHAKIIEKATPC